MIRTLALLAAFTGLSAHPAQASFWVECEYIVSGNITADEGGLYAITPISSKVTGGHSEKGTSCHDEDLEYPIKIKIAGEKPENMKAITLHYTFFNGMGPDGVINDESWSFIQPNILERLF